MHQVEEKTKHFAHLQILKQRAGNHCFGTHVGVQTGHCCATWPHKKSVTRADVWWFQNRSTNCLHPGFWGQNLYVGAPLKGMCKNIQESYGLPGAGPVKDHYRFGVSDRWDGAERARITAWRREASGGILSACINTWWGRVMKTEPNSVEPSARTRGSGHKLEDRRLPLNIRKFFCAMRVCYAGGWTLE